MQIKMKYVEFFLYDINFVILTLLEADLSRQFIKKLRG